MKTDKGQTIPKCFMCQTPVANSEGVFELIIYAVVGSKFARYGYGVGGSRPREGEHSIFTPVGKKKIAAGCCELCTKKSREKWAAKSAQSRKESIRFLVGLLCVVLLALASLPLVTKFHFAEAWHLLPLGIAGLAALVSATILLDVFGGRAKNNKGFSIQPSFLKSDAFRSEIAAIAPRINLSEIRLKFGSPSSLGPVLLEVKTIETFALKKNLLFLVGEPDLTNLTACDFFDGRYWYIASAASGESLAGYDSNGSSSGFKWVYPDLPKMTEAKDVRFRDDKNANIQLG